MDDSSVLNNEPGQPSNPAVARQKGPVEILCKEIGFRFDRRMERIEIFAAFVAVLVDHVSYHHYLQQRILGFCKGMDGAQIVKPDDDSPKAIAAARHMLALSEPADLIAAAAAVHDLCHELNPEDRYPTNHTIDMLSSCASAIRFGLEKPCHSRHAAEAASHIWKQRYGLSLFDEYTPAWEDEWSRAQMQEAILRLAIAPQTETEPAPPGSAPNPDDPNNSSRSITGTGETGRP